MKNGPECKVCGSEMQKKEQEVVPKWIPKLGIGATAFLGIFLTLTVFFAIFGIPFLVFAGVMHFAAKKIPTAKYWVCPDCGAFVPRHPYSN